MRIIIWVWIEYKEHKASMGQNRNIFMTIHNPPNIRLVRAKWFNVIRRDNKKYMIVHIYNSFNNTRWSMIQSEATRDETRWNMIQSEAT